MIPICMPLSLTLCVNARDYTTESTRVKGEARRMNGGVGMSGLHLSPFILHPSLCRARARQYSVATLADLSSRDVMQVWRKCTAMKTLPIGGKKRILWEMKWPFAITNNQLKG